jgi:predicted CXXCH cytochrome family protein
MSTPLHTRILCLGFLLGSPLVTIAQQPIDQCLTCHTALGDKPSHLFTGDIHARKGVKCTDCHGGDASSDDPEKAMSPSRGFTGVPKGDRISEVCGTCHSHAERLSAFGSRLPTGQLEMLKAGVHGKSSLKGGERLAECTTCHGAHGIVSVHDPRSPVYPLNIIKTCTRCHADASYMRAYNLKLPVDQLEKYRTSVHGQRNAKGDPRAAECASCHGSHDIRPAGDVKSRVYAANLPGTCARCHSDKERMASYGIPTNQYDLYAKSVHGVALLEKHDLSAPACNDCHGNHGATPPGLESISKVCGTCHALNAELFAASPHKTAFDSRKLPECETCHGNHAIVAATERLLGNTAEAVCSRCHSSTDNVRGFQAAGAMRLMTDSLEQETGRAKALVQNAEQKGMEIAEAKFKLRDARQSRLEARTMVHAFNEARYREVIAKGRANVEIITAEASGQIDEYYFRRWGLGISTLVIGLLAVSLYLWLRKIEAPQENRQSKP